MNHTQIHKDFLLETYGALYGPEAGPWNLSAESKYLEYKITAFFEEHFSVSEDMEICNIGIGAGYWDRYLSYRGGRLTSIDRDGRSCRQLREGLLNEGNPNPVTILHRDVMDCGELRFDIVTMVGSTRTESGLFESIMKRVFGLLKPGGSFYYQSLDQRENRAAVEALCRENGMSVDVYRQDTAYGRTAHYGKLTRMEEKAAIHK